MSKARLSALVGLLGVVLGTYLPWIRVDYDATDSGIPGFMCRAIAIVGIAAVLLAGRAVIAWVSLLIALAALLLPSIVFIDLPEFGARAWELDEPSPSQEYKALFGLYFTLLSSVVAVAGAAVHALSLSHSDAGRVSERQ